MIEYFFFWSFFYRDSMVKDSVENEEHEDRGERTFVILLSQTPSLNFITSKVDCLGEKKRKTSLF